MKKWMAKRALPVLLSITMIMGMGGVPVHAVGGTENMELEQGNTLCAHHTEHTADCGYSEAQPCTHEHGEECYKTVTKCLHTHTDECYPDTEETDGGTGEGNAASSEEDSREPVNCTHRCQSDETGCVTKVLDCRHEHDESCGYAEAQECGYVCEICGGTEPENTENDTKETEDEAGGGKTEGEEPKDADTNLCAHHTEHTAGCGYSEDDHTPCGYACRICAIEDLTAGLPDKVTEENADHVRARLDTILSLYRKLTEEEQGQIDLSRCYELQGALDAANTPVTAETSWVCGQVSAVLEGDTLILSGTGAMEEYPSPSGYPWYTSKDSIVKVVVRDGVTSIGKFAFQSYDSKLVSVEISGSVASIGNGAFNSCKALTSVKLSQGTASIEKYAFAGCGSLHTIEVPASVTTIGERAFLKLEVIYGGTLEQWNKIGKTSEAAQVYGAPHSVTVNGGGSVGATGAGSHNEGRTVTVSAGIKTDHVFDGWTAEGVAPVDTGSPTLSFTMPANDVTLTANWRKAADGDYVAQVEQGGEVRRYVTLKEAWSALPSGESTLTLLKDAETDEILGVGAGKNVTVKMENGVTLTTGEQNCFNVTGGTLTLTESCSIRKGGEKNSLVYIPSGTLYIKGGSYWGSRSGNGVYANDAATVRISGGTFTVQKQLFRYEKRPVREMLAENYALSRGGNKLPVSDLNGSTFSSSGAACTVGPCEHGEVKPTSNNDGTHTLNCSYCSYSSAGACSFGDWTDQKDGTHKGACTVCGYEKTEAHTWENGACTVCKSTSQPVTADMAELSETECTYNGKEQKPTLTVRNGQTMLTEGTDYEISYSRSGASTDDFTNAGTVTITIKGKGIYAGEVKKIFTIKQAEPDVGTVTAEVLENTLDVSQASLSRTNQTPAGTLTLTDSALEYGVNTYTWKFTPDDTVNYKTVTGEVQITVNDTVPPSAEYRIGTDGWKQFIHTVSFGLFCKDYKTVTIRSTDDTDTVTGSGVRLTQYYISDQEITDTDNIEWSPYTKAISLDAQGAYLIYVKVTDQAGNTAVLNSEGIVVYAESTLSAEAFDYTYKENRDCTVGLAMNGNTFKGLTDQEGNVIDTKHYTIDGNGLILKAAYLDTLDKGGYAYRVSVNPQGIGTDQVTLAYTFTVNVKARKLTVTGAAATDRAYDGTNAVEITAVTLSGAAPDDDVAVELSGIEGTLNGVHAGTYTEVTLPELTLTGADCGNYTLVQPAAAVPASVAITPLDAEITVGTDAYSKTFGDAAFTLDVTDNNTEADVRYEVTKGADVISVENGTVTILGAGEAEITLSLPESANYHAAESKTITVTVKKKGGYTVAALNRSYFYQNGGTDSIDLAALLPADGGSVTYGKPTVSGDISYGAAPAVNGGKLSYTLSGGSAAAEGTITVIAATQNYEDITVTVNVKLTDRIPVSLKAGTEVTLKNHVLTYGEPLSNLVFHEAEFVTADGKTVTGALAWKEADAIPDAGTASAVWIFTPAGDQYADLEGTAAITVNRAVPTVSAAPTVADRVYNPSLALKNDDLSGSTVTGVDGKELKGGWSWQGAGFVPNVNNSGYAAVFIPEDTTNYETVTRTVTVNVTKATPYIAKAPAAAAITYGDTLLASALSGGTVLYGDGAGQAGNGGGNTGAVVGNTAAVAGTFTWKEPSAKPAVADSGATEYTVIFTPADTANFHPTEAKVKLTVNKAQNAPNMPGSAMDVSSSCGKVGDVPLPEGWEWQASDRDTALEAGKTISAVAVYTGADQGSYENETVTVAITKSACDHAAGPVLYTGAGEKAPACTEDGLGHRECTRCGAVVESGIVVKALGHTGGTATCSGRAVCTRCGRPYGDTAGGVHNNTEVRGIAAASCTAGGYTGDTYCKDCGAKTKTGNATPALGHDYSSAITKKPTTGSEGVRTYTCVRCGLKFTESIPKLPEETHRHSYTERVTKQPTCTDTGVRIHTCACGDSYTETMAALGHHYQSSETRKPTAAAEGIMTYTCERCGHSYTRPITKLPGNHTTKPGDAAAKQPGDKGPYGGNAEETGSDSGGTLETGPDAGIPFIKDEDGKIGWDVIRAEEEKAEEGSTIHVDMNGSTVVPGDIFDTIRGRDITVTFDMGNDILWSVDGGNVTTDKAGDIDFSVKTGVNTVPVDIINNVTGESYSIQLSLSYEGEFGFTAVLSLSLGKENAGYTASLYYYNESTGELTFICSDEVEEDGTVSLAFTHASDYVIAIDGEKENGNVTESAQPGDQDGDRSKSGEHDGNHTKPGDQDRTGSAEESPQIGQAWRPWWLIVIGALVIVMGIGGFFVVKKKKKDD